MFTNSTQETSRQLASPGAACLRRRAVRLFTGPQCKKTDQLAPVGKKYACTRWSTMQVAVIAILATFIACAADRAGNAAEEQDQQKDQAKEGVKPAAYKQIWKRLGRERIGSTTWYVVMLRHRDAQKTLVSFWKIQGRDEAAQQIYDFLNTPSMLVNYRDFTVRRFRDSKYGRSAAEQLFLQQVAAGVNAVLAQGN